MENCEDKEDEEDVREKVKVRVVVRVKVRVRLLWGGNIDNFCILFVRVYETNLCILKSIVIGRYLYSTFTKK